MVLSNSGVLKITGERGADRMLNEDTVSISFNPVLSTCLAIEEKGSKHKLEDVLLFVKSHHIFKDLLTWEKMNFLYASAVLSAEGHPSEAAQAVVKEIEDTKEMVELELQKSQLILDMSKGLSVKAPPDYAKNESELNANKKPESLIKTGVRA